MTLTAPIRPPAAPRCVLTRSRSRTRLGQVTRPGFLRGTAGDADTASPTPPATRVVALGQGADADALIALGITPVGMSTASNQESGLYPWTVEGTTVCGAVLELPEIVDDLTRRRFLGGLIALGVLGGCAEGTGSPSAPTSTPTATGARIAHDGGEVTLTQIPSRIVTLGSEVVELAVALGIQPVGIGARVMNAARADQAFDGYYLTPAQIGTPRYVGPDPYNLEAIAALQPDLIVLTYQSEQSTKLGDIAPTVRYEYWGVSGTWQDSLRRLGTGLGREPQAAAAIAAYEGAVASGRSKLLDVVSKAPRVSVVYPDFRGGGTNIVYAAEYQPTQPAEQAREAHTGPKRAGRDRPVERFLFRLIQHVIAGLARRLSRS